MASFERKFVGGLESEGIALSWLRHVCVPAPSYSDEIIHSVYFDTPQMTCFYEKIDGDFKKTKVRLRWYEDGNEKEGKAFLEVKRKFGGSREKVRKEVSLDREWLINADLSDHGFMNILRENADIGEMLPCGLFPSIEICYRRYRFICPETMIGVSLDTAIGFNRVNSFLIPGISCGSISSVVIELKGENRDDLSWLNKIHQVGFRSDSFSKYGECVSMFLGDD